MSYIKFLGTAGARVVMSKQIRATAGIYLNLNETNLYLDPGPGALVKCLSSKPKIEPSKLDGIILTHKHLDHSNDINIMMEAMSEAGFKKRGVVFSPKEVLEEGIIFKYVRDYVEKIEILEEGKNYEIGNISFSTPIKHIHHRSETYGIKFKTKHFTLSYIVDAKFSEELLSSYKADYLIICVVFLEKRENLDHLSIPEAKEIILGIKPKVAILTHFGMNILKAKPWELATKIEEETKIKTIAARDGMKINLPL